MKRTFNSIVGLFYGTLGFAFLAGIGVLMFIDLGGWFGAICLTIMVVLGLLVLWLTFSMVSERGFLENRAATFSTPLLDKWLENENPNKQNIKPAELIPFIAETPISTLSGAVYLWGDNEQFGLNGRRKLVKAEWKSESKNLTLHFSGNAKMMLTNPLQIISTENYLKIEKADAVKWVCHAPQRNETRGIEVSWEKSRAILKTKGWDRNGARFMKGYPALFFFWAD